MKALQRTLLQCLNFLNARARRAHPGTSKNQAEEPNKKHTHVPKLRLLADKNADFPTQLAPRELVVTSDHHSHGTATRWLRAKMAGEEELTQNLPTYGFSNP